MAPIGVTAGATVTSGDLADAGALLVTETLTELQEQLERAVVTSG
jgi:hypothetical protein